MFSQQSARKEKSRRAHDDIFSLSVLFYSNVNDQFSLKVQSTSQRSVKLCVLVSFDVSHLRNSTAALRDTLSKLGGKFENIMHISDSELRAKSLKTEFIFLHSTNISLRIKRIIL